MGFVWSHITAKWKDQDLQFSLKFLIIALFPYYFPQMSS